MTPNSSCLVLITPLCNSLPLSLTWIDWSKSNGTAFPRWGYSKRVTSASGGARNHASLCAIRRSSRQGIKAGLSAELGRDRGLSGATRLSLRRNCNPSPRRDCSPLGDHQAGDGSHTRMPHSHKLWSSPCLLLEAIKCGGHFTHNTR